MRKEGDIRLVAFINGISPPIRETAGNDGNILGQMAEYTKIIIISGPVFANNMT